MPIPPECQPLADQLSSLNAQEAAARDVLKNLTGVDKWRKMLELGTIRQQIADTQKLLTECEKQHFDDLNTEVVVIDLTGNAGPNRIARVWNLTSDGQAVKQTVTVQDGIATFNNLLGTARQAFGITIEETDHPTVNGPDFRSGPLPTTHSTDQPDPIGRIEIVILDPVTVTADSLTQAAPALPIQFSFPAGPVGNISISVTGLNVVMSSGNVSLTATGTASGASFPFPTSSPFTFSSTVHIAPTFKMAPSTIVEVLSGTVPVLSIPGLIGTVVNDIGRLFSSSLRDRAVQPMVALLNASIAKQVASALGLSALPSGAVLSIRDLSADNDTITITPVLGAFGTVLSDFLPSAPEAVVRLADISVFPALIVTGDSTQSVAKGQVILDGPASPGGVTVQLSCDRTDVMTVDPVAVLIPEGLAFGNFTVSAVGQPLMSSAVVDGTVRASLGTQTLTAPLSVRPQQSATVLPPPATPAPPPFSGAPDIMSLAVMTPSPLPLRQPISGQITLNSMHPEGPVTGIIAYEPPVVPPQSFLLPAGSVNGFFSFTLGASFPGNTLRITAWTDKGGVRRSIDVGVGV